jgi:hypothetical protein
MSLRSYDSTLYDYYLDNIKDIPIDNISDGGVGSVFESPSHLLTQNDDVILSDNEYYYGHYRVLEATNDTFTLNITYKDTASSDVVCQTSKMNDIEQAIAYYIYAEMIVVFSKISVHNGVGGSANFKQGTMSKASSESINRMRKQYLSMATKVLDKYKASTDRTSINVYSLGGNRGYR